MKISKKKNENENDNEKNKILEKVNFFFQIISFKNIINI